MSRRFKGLPDDLIEEIIVRAGDRTKFYAISMDWSRVWRDRDWLHRKVLRDHGVYCAMERLREKGQEVPEVMQYLCCPSVTNPLDPRHCFFVQVNKRQLFKRLVQEEEKLAEKPGYKRTSDMHRLVCLCTEGCPAWRQIDDDIHMLDVE